MASVDHRDALEVGQGEHHHVCVRIIPTRLPVKDVKKAGAAHLAPSISADAFPGRCLVAKANFTGTMPTEAGAQGSRDAAEWRAGRQSTIWAPCTLSLSAAC